MKTDRQTLIDLQDDFLTFYDPKSEYGIGYLDCLYEVCEGLKIPAERFEYFVKIGS